MPDSVTQTTGTRQDTTRNDSEKAIFKNRSQIQLEQEIDTDPDGGFSLKENIHQVEQIKYYKGCVSGAPKTKEPLEVISPSDSLDFTQIIEAIDDRMKKIGMTQKIGKKYLNQVYGVKSRLLLNDNNLLDFWAFMERQNDLSEIMLCIS